METPSFEILRFKPDENAEVCLVGVSNADGGALLLTAEEKNRLVQIRHPRKAKEFLAARAALKNLNVGPLQYLGKRPILAQGYISISHTSEIAGCVYSPLHPVGLDIESPRPQLQKIERKFLRPDELDFVHSGDLEDFKRQVMWSAKEALFKLWGEGNVDFRQNLEVEQFEISDSGFTHALIRFPNRVIRCKIHYRFVEGHYVVVAVEGN